VGITALGLLALGAGAVYLFAAAGASASTLWLAGATGAMLTMLLASTIANFVRRMVVRAQGGPEVRARENVLRFLRTRPDWSVHVYRTPAGLRLLATHRLFDPRGAEVAACFKELRTDPVYVAMCLNQHCFRARVSAKPWRIGIKGRLTPRRGVWPVSPERLPQRRTWLEQYDRAAAEFAACRFVESLGSGVSAPPVRPVQQLHDELCRARSDLPIA
jgi:hypothetical protein